MESFFRNFYRFLGIFFVTLLLEAAFAKVLECDYTMQTSHWGVDYACVPNEFQTSLQDRKVTDVTGEHIPGKANTDVKKLYIKKLNCAYLPLNVGKFFKNLETLYVMKSNVQHLIDGDLDGLTNLKVFDVSHNPIESLSSGFFKGHDTIEIISFYDCNLKSIAADALTPLTNLREAHFQYNVCVDFYDTSNIFQLVREIKRNCGSERPAPDLKNSKLCDLESMSFMRSNAYIVISILILLLVALSVVLIQLVRRNFGGNWSQLREALI